jgi:transcriptional regulator with XRE-family HTH domain
VEWTAQDGAALRRLRDDKGLTQRQVSVALDVAQAAVSGWERGESRPRKANALALGELVGDVDAVLAVCGYANGSSVEMVDRLQAQEERIARLEAQVERLGALVLKGADLGVHSEVVEPRKRRRS